ncbi:MAG TPA: rod shape-determining protein MreC [Candidatus Acidoferrales bacterium]|nr:rod shape-determining protein MreC [Candidatus Acidoferrales bacterium]
MVDIPTRRRPLALLAIVVVAQVLLLAFQVRHGGAARDKNVPLIRYWAVETIMPLERAASWMFSGVGGVWSGYIDLRHERKQNIDLRAENGELKLRNHELETEFEEARRMDALLQFRHEHPEAPMAVAEVVATTRAMVAAHVMGGSADPASHTVFINRGAHDGIRREMGVITPDGIVGKIVEVFPHAAQVQLISDRESGVGAMFAASHAHGIVKGTGDPDPQMDYIVNEERVQPGDEIITSGDDRIFPKGLSVGVVADDKAASPFQVIHIRTAAHLDRLEDVLVLLTSRDLNLKSVSEPSAAHAEPSNSKVPSSGAAQHQAAPAAKLSKPGATASPKTTGPKTASPKPETQKPAAVKAATPTSTISKPAAPKAPDSQPAGRTN